jgi:Acyl-CoA dehydrogenase, N-terminal domain
VTHLALAPEVEQLREIVRPFCRDRLSSAAGDAENQRLIPAHLIRSLNELGILSPLDSNTDQVPDPVAMVVVAEELGAADPGVAYETISGAHAALAISQVASDAQRTSIIDRGPSGAVPLGSLWFYEGFGRGPDEYLTTIERTGDQLTLDGRKTAVVRPGTADFAVVIGRCSDRAVAVGKKQGLRFLALVGIMNSIMFIFFSIPHQWFSTHADYFPHDVVDKSWFTNQMCGIGTDYACPGPRVPIPVGPDSGHATPSGGFDAPAGLPVQVSPDRGK